MNNVLKTSSLPSPPGSWSALSWHQLFLCWNVKMRYAANADVARSAALLALLELDVLPGSDVSEESGEKIFVLRDAEGGLWTATAREVSWIARQALPWFDYPYGDPGDPVVKDDKGKVIKEKREPVIGYVSQMRDAMMPPLETLKVGRKVFALPQVACNNLTWEQYRSLQGIVPKLFVEGISDEQAMELQAQFLAHITVPRSLAILDSTGGSIRLRVHWEYKYDAGHAEAMEKWWLERLRRKYARKAGKKVCDSDASILYHVCLQVYQTALSYYTVVYPTLFQDSGKADPLRDALTGEVGTINTVMKYAGYAEQQQVYDSNVPFVFDILNTMTKEAKEIEKMNSRIKKK